MAIMQRWFANHQDFDKAGNKPRPRQHLARLRNATVTIPLIGTVQCIWIFSNQKLHCQKVQIIIVINLCMRNIGGCFSTTFCAPWIQVTMQRQFLSMACASPDYCWILLAPPFQDRSRCSGATDPVKGQYALVKLRPMIIGENGSHVFDGIQPCWYPRYTGVFA